MHISNIIMNCIYFLKAKKVIHLRGSIMDIIKKETKGYD